MRQVYRLVVAVTLLALGGCVSTEGVLLELRPVEEGEPTWQCNTGVLELLEQNGRSHSTWLPVEDCAASDLFCTQGPEGELGCEPWLCPHGTDGRIQLRMTSIQWRAPVAMTNALLQALADDTVDEMESVWLLDLDVGAGVLLTGPGDSRDEGSPSFEAEDICSAAWHPTLPPAEVAGVTVTAGGLLQARMPSLPLVMCLGFAGDCCRETCPPLPTGPLCVPWALREVDVELPLSPDRALMGSPREAVPDSVRFADRWETAGTATGWLPMEPSRATSLSWLGMTLCGLLSGDRPDSGDPDQDCTSPMEEWEHPPELIPGTDELGWRFEADLGAAAVTIED